jgi:hypothetical protein
LVKVAVRIFNRRDNEEQRKKGKMEKEHAKKEKK